MEKATRADFEGRGRRAQLQRTEESEQFMANGGAGEGGFQSVNGMKHCCCVELAAFSLGGTLSSPRFCSAHMPRPPGPSPTLFPPRSPPGSDLDSDAGQDGGEEGEDYDSEEYGTEESGDEGEDEASTDSDD